MTCNDCKWAYENKSLWCMNIRSEYFGNVVDADKEQCADVKEEENVNNVQ